VGVPLQGHTGAITLLHFHQIASTLSQAHDDKTIQIWNAKTGKAVAIPLVGHTEAVMSVAFSQDGKYIISGSDDKTLRIWDAEVNVRGASVRFITPKIQFSSNPHHALCEVHSLLKMLWISPVTGEILFKFKRMGGFWAHIIDFCYGFHLCIFQDSTVLEPSI
jgi:WD40 repeat protein